MSSVRPPDMYIPASHQNNLFTSNNFNSLSNFSTRVSPPAIRVAHQSQPLLNNNHLQKRAETN